MKSLSTAVLFLLALLSGYDAFAHFRIYEVDRVNKFSKYHNLDFYWSYASVRVGRINNKSLQFSEHPILQTDLTDSDYILIGTKGILEKTRINPERICQLDSCGDREECFFDIRLYLDENKDIGEPIIAVGHVKEKITNFESFLDVEEIPLTSGLSTISKLDLSETGAHYVLHGRHLSGVDRDEYLKRCRLRRFGDTGFEAIDCGSGSEILMHDRELVYYSVTDDYGAPLAKIFNRFYIGNKLYYTAARGTKGHTKYGLLFEENGKWQWVFTDYEGDKPC